MKEIFRTIIILFIVLGLFTAQCYKAIDYELSKTEIETYTVGMEISQMAYAEEAVNRHSTRPVYKMGLRNDDFAIVLEITDVAFAMYTVGEVAEVEVTVYEYRDGTQEKEYKLIY